MIYSTPIPISGKFPYLQTMNLIMEIEMALAGNECILSSAIKGAIHRQVKADEIIKTCKDNIRDNEIVMSEMLGNKLVAKLKSYSL